MARRQRASWGCVQRVRPGTYRIRYMRDGVRRSETVRGTRREADDRLAALRVECGSAPAARPVTVGQAYERHYLPLAEGAADTTRANTLSAWRVHVAPRWEGVALRDVRPCDVQEWLLTLTAAQARSALRVLRGVFREAALYGLVDGSPLSVAFRMPRRVDSPRPRSTVEPSLMGAYYAAALSEGLGAMFILAACCGLRVGESLGPRVGEVLREERGGVAVAAVPVLRQVGGTGAVAVRDEGGREVERLKTRKSARWAAVGGEWAERLLSLQDEARGRGDVWLTDDGLGGPLSQKAARAAWGRAVEAAGLPPVLLKNLRATFATQMDARDVPVEQIARLMGHSTPSITFDVYERPGMDRAVQIAARAAGFGEVGTI